MKSRLARQSAFFIGVVAFSAKCTKKAAINL